jgi:hypothetical protein
MTLAAATLNELDPSLGTLLSPSRGLRWRNYIDGGDVISWHQVNSLMNRVGTSEAWTFLVVTSRAWSGRFVQSCGDATSGLAVEVGAGSTTNLVAPVGSERYPAVLITRESWPYYATTGELHNVGTATEIFYKGIAHGELAAGLELRPRRPGSGIERYPS